MAFIRNINDIIINDENRDILKRSDTHISYVLLNDKNNITSCIDHEKREKSKDPIKSKVHEEIRYTRIIREQNNAISK
jgi:hypothetical protein